MADLTTLTSVESGVERYLLVAKNAKAGTIGSILLEAVNDPQTLVFGELLDLAADKGIAEDSPELLLCRIFAYGTFSDLQANADKVPKVTANGLQKLRLLTVISLSTESRILPYDLLLKRLDLSSVRDLEDLLIGGIYRGIFRGKLDQKRARFEILDSIGRDVQGDMLEDVLQDFRGWCRNTEQVMRFVEENAFSAQELYTRLRAEKEKAEKEKEDAQAEDRETQLDPPIMPMDMDPPRERGF